MTKNDLNELKHKIAVNPSYSDYIQLADELCKIEDYGEALAVFSHASTLDFGELENVKIHWNYAWLLFSLDRIDHALSLMRDVDSVLEKLNIENPEAFYLRGTANSLISQSLRDIDEARLTSAAALGFLKRLMIDSPKFDSIVFAKLQVARLENIFGDPKNAIKICQDLMVELTDPAERVDCLLEFAASCRLLGDISTGLRIISGAIDLSNELPAKAPEIYWTVGLLQRSANLSADAIKSFQKAIHLLDTQARKTMDHDVVLKEAGLELAELLYESRNFAEALQLSQRIYSLHTEDDLWRRNVLAIVAQSLHGMGRLQDAKENYERVLLSPNASELEKASTLLGLGKVYSDLGDVDNAITCFETGRKFFSWDDSLYADCLIWLGSCYTAKQDYSKAKKCFAEVQGTDKAAEGDRKLASQWLESLPEIPDRELH